MKKVLYPGTFDPITNGHLDIINRTAKMVDELHIVIFDNHSKYNTFSVEERVNFIKASTNNLTNVVVNYSSELAVKYCDINNINTIVRGIRNFSDFQSEFNLSTLNKDLNSNIETIFLASDLANLAVSSTSVKELLKFNQDISKYVPKQISNEVMSIYPLKKK